MKTKDVARPAAAFVAAVIATAALGSVVQSQFNLVAIAGFGVSVPAGLWVATTGEDLMRFGPVMAAIAGAALLPALIAALFLSRALPAWRAAICALAGVVGLWTAFSAMGLFTPMPTLVAAVRNATGLAAMCSAGAVGSLVFARLTRCANA